MKLRIAWTHLDPHADPHQRAIFGEHSNFVVLNSTPPQVPHRPLSAAELAAVELEHLYAGRAPVRQPEMHAMILANRVIGEYNNGAACEAAFVSTSEDGSTLRWAAVGDCFVAVISQSGELRTISDKTAQDWLEEHRKFPGLFGKGSFALPSFQRRNPLRQNRKVRQLTGSPDIMKKVTIQEVESETGDRIVLGSRQMLPLVCEPGFEDNLSSAEDFAAWTVELSERDGELDLTGGGLQVLVRS